MLMMMRRRMMMRAMEAIQWLSIATIFVLLYADESVPERSRGHVV